MLIDFWTKKTTIHYVGEQYGILVMPMCSLLLQNVCFDVGFGKKKRMKNVGVEKMTLFGERIQGRRLQLGMTQEDLANLVGVHRQTVIAWVGNENRPRGKAIVALSEILGVNSAWIVDGTAPQLPVSGVFEWAKTQSDFDSLQHYSLSDLIELRRMRTVKTTSMNDNLSGVNKSDSDNTSSFIFEFNYSPMTPSFRLGAIKLLNESFSMLQSNFSQMTDMQIAELSFALRDVLKKMSPV